MAAMKACAIYPMIVKRFSDIKENHSGEWNAHVLLVESEHRYNDFLTRISWDLLRCCFTTQEICNWYREYSIHDSHITTAVRKAYVDVFGAVQKA